MIWQHPLCDKESDPRASAEALQLLLMGIATLNPSYLAKLRFHAFAATLRGDFNSGVEDVL